MTEARIGRLLAACLHGAISDELPQRLDFYEEWLTPDGLRDGTIGLAPISAVIGFLRTEDGDVYDRVTGRAGELAAVWSVAAIAQAKRRAVGWLPPTWRARAALRVAARIVRDLQGGGRAATRVRRGNAQMDVTPSLFCAAREAQPAPMCAFYVALAVAVLRDFGIGAVGRAERCRATGAASCLVALSLGDVTPSPDPAIAA